MTTCQICNKGDVCDWKYHKIKIMQNENNYYLYTACESCRDKVHRFIIGLSDEASK